MSFYEIRHLQDNGVKIVQKSPWHFHAVRGNRYVNIWPTKHKWMVMYDSGASYYDDAKHLLEIVRNVLRPANPRWLVDRLIKEMEARKTPRQREAEAFQKEWLGVFVEYLTLP